MYLFITLECKNKFGGNKNPTNAGLLLKSRNYNWKGIDKYWWKQIDLEETDSEMKWLEENVYEGPFRGMIEEVTLVDKYKD